MRWKLISANSQARQRYVCAWEAAVQRRTRLQEKEEVVEKKDSIGLLWNWQHRHDAEISRLRCCRVVYCGQSNATSQNRIGVYLRRTLFGMQGPEYGWRHEKSNLSRLRFVIRDCPKKACAAAEATKFNVERQSLQELNHNMWKGSGRWTKIRGKKWCGWRRSALDNVTM